MQPISSEADDVVEFHLEMLLNEIASGVEATDAITYVGPIEYGTDDVFRTSVSNLRSGKTRRGRHVLVILETEGGYIEVAKRIADTLHNHYTEVSFLIPNYAMSAGTVLAMSGDRIYMDDYSVLGPIDPQVRKGGKYVPALGYLEQYNRLIEKSANGKLSAAELAYLIQNFDPAELYQYEQAKKLSNLLLREWLVKYKFRNWTRTQKRRRKVTRAMKIERANEIADKLNDTGYWNSHAHGISMRVARNHLNIRIDDFRDNRDFSMTLDRYYRLLKDYVAKYRLFSLIHTRLGYVPLGAAR